MDDARQCVDFAHEVRAIATHLIESKKYSYANLADRVQLNEHTLFQFITRSSVRPKYSATLHQLFIFFAEEFEIALVSDAPDIHELVKKIRCARPPGSTAMAPVFASFARMMDSSPNRTNRACSNFNGLFYVYRFSTLPGRVVKTELRILADEEMAKAWRFEHRYKDRLQAERVTRGYIMVTIGSVYCIGKIGSGFGLETIVFSEPVSEQPEILQALIMSTDTKSQPIVSKAVIRRAREVETIGAFNLMPNLASQDTSISVSNDIDLERERSEVGRFIDLLVNISPTPSSGKTREYTLEIEKCVSLNDF